MKKQWMFLAIVLIIMNLALPLKAQLTESGEPVNEATEKAVVTTVKPQGATPMNGICKRECNTKKRLLSYDHLHERDVMWEKRIWREIHLNERINQHFAYAEKPLISVLMQEAEAQRLTLYSPLDDKFSSAMEVDEIKEMWGTHDTITVFNPDTYADSIVVVFNEFNPQDVESYRVKEVWYFDSQRSEMKVRILGIAPIANKYDEEGNFIASMPLFWIYYPDAREVLLQHETFDPLNGSTALAWDDVFEARLFHGQIVKESNIYDRRIQDYASGMNALLEAEKIHEGIRNYEHDLWSY